MKKTVFVLAMTASSLTAEEGRKTLECGLTATTVASSKYLGNLVGGIFYEEPIAFTDLVIACSDKAGATYVDLWSATPLTTWSWDRNYGTEYDFILGRTLKLGRKNAEGVSLVRLDVNGTYLAVHPLAHFNGHIYTLAGRADFLQVKFAQPYVQTYYFGRVGQNSPQSGMFFHAGARRTQSLNSTFNERPVTLGLDYRFGYSGGALGAGWGPAYNRLTAGLNIPVSKDVTVVPAVVGQIPFHRRDPFGILGDRPSIFLLLAISYHWGK